jgi:uncharacterized membrane protein YqjE
LAGAESVPGLASGGSLMAVRQLSACLLALLRIRLELISLEIAEERDRWALLLVLSAFAALLGAGAVLFAALCVTLLYWDTHRLTAALACTAALAIGGALCGWRLRRCLLRMDAPAASSLAQLRADEAALKGQSWR